MVALHSRQDFHMGIMIHMPRMNGGQLRKRRFEHNKRDKQEDYIMGSIEECISEHRLLTDRDTRTTSHDFTYPPIHKAITTSHQLNRVSVHTVGSL
jgi:hypothetical protein